MVKVLDRDSILGLSQKYKISLVLASHYHNAQFMGIPYKVLDNKYPKMPDPKKNPMKPKPSVLNNKSSLNIENVSPYTAVDDAGKSINVNVNTDDHSFNGQSLLEFTKICFSSMEGNLKICISI